MFWERLGQTRGEVAFFESVVYVTGMAIMSIDRQAGPSCERATHFY